MSPEIDSRCHCQIPLKIRRELKGNWGKKEYSRIMQTEHIYFDYDLNKSGKVENLVILKNHDSNLATRARISTNKHFFVHPISDHECNGVKPKPYDCKTGEFVKGYTDHYRGKHRSETKGKGIRAFFRSNSIKQH